MVWKGTNKSLTGLWVLPLKQIGKIAQPRIHNTDNHTANNAYQMTSKEIDTGFKVTYDTKHIKVFYKVNVVWKGTRESLT